MSKRLATIIFCTHYHAKALMPFNHPGLDTDALVGALLDPDIGNFDTVEAIVDRPAGEVLNHLEELFKYRKPYDLVCVYYVGLGIVDSYGGVYLATIDSDPSSLSNSAIPATVLAGWMDNSFSRQQILIFDNNFVSINLAGKPASMIEKMDPVDAFRGKGYWRLVLSSTLIFSPLQDDDLVLVNSATSSYTALVIRGLETGDADVDKDGVIGLQDLHNYLKQEMQSRGMNLKPQLHTFVEKEDFVLAKTVSAARDARGIKWDVISGAITLPIAILILGWKADIIVSVEAAFIFLLFYAVLYRYGD